MPESLSDRLRALDTLLAGSRTALVGTARQEIEAVELSLRSVAFDRITKLTKMLAEGSARGTDDVDRLAAQLLLADYRNAVANLRAATQVVASRLTAASASLKSVRGFARRQEKIADKKLKQRS